MIDFELADIKLESSEANFLKLVLEKICRRISKLFKFFVKMQFETVYADISDVFIPTRNWNNIFLKFHHFLLRIPKIVETG